MISTKHRVNSVYETVLKAKYTRSCEYKECVTFKNKLDYYKICKINELFRKIILSECQVDQYIISILKDL
jgi:hypothetical protein